MDLGWRDYTALKGGESGARASFEYDCKQLLEKIYPNEQVDTIRANPGDDGVDIYVGSIGQEPIIVYQCKFFLEKFGDAQKQQVRESFNTAIRSEAFSMKGWHLMVPYQEFDLNQSLWLENWKKKEQEKYNLESNFIQVVNGNEIISLMKNHKIYDSVFQIRHLLNIKETNSLVKEIHKSIFPQKNNNIIERNDFDTDVIKEIFDILYTSSYENYYVIRNIDLLVENSLKFHKNIWVYGESGVGKTTLINRILKRKCIQYHYCYLTSIVSAESVESIFQEIADDLTEKYITDSNTLISSKNVIKKLIDILIKADLEDVVVIYIDEITVANEVVFSTFVNYIIALCNNYSLVSHGKRSIKFVLSTIQQPIQFCENKPKASETFDFLENETWEESELRSLLEKISSNLGLEISIMDTRIILKASKGSPRRLKTFLYSKIMNYEKSYDSIINIYSKEID